jgi:HlyD family secretion protein
MPPPKRRGRRWSVWLPIALVAGIALWWWHSRAQGELTYRTAVVDRGTIAVTISSTGSLSAISTIDIGAQVSGLVQAVLVDYNDRVHKDQVIARIDPSNLNAKVQQAAGAVAASQGQLAQAQATAKNAEADFARKSDLGQRQLIAHSDVDAARAARGQAEGAVAAAQAQIAAQQAALASAKLDLEHSLIRSPVDGVVINRSVEPGQTVAASLQTPTLFQIAEDLRQMQIVLAVDEADIGQVKVGERVRFNVDAFPDRDFNGTVKQIRLGATNTQNVITYPVVVTVDNDDLTLLPGMTVNAEIQVSRRDNVLRVPNAALRFKPADAPPQDANAPGQTRGGGMLTDELPKIATNLQLDANQQAAFDQAMAVVRERAKAMRAARDAAPGTNGQNAGAGLFGRFPGANQQQPGNAAGGGRGGAQRMLARISQQFADFRAKLRPEQQQAWDGALQSLAAVKRATIWKLVAGKPQPVSVRIAASDGSFTELVDDALAPGDAVIVGAAAADAHQP